MNSHTLTPIFARAKESCSQNRVRKSVLLIFVLIALVSSASMPFPNWAFAQANPPASPTPTAASDDVQPIGRRPPAPFSTHGSISGSQPNELADHPIARLLDQISEQNYYNLTLGLNWHPLDHVRVRPEIRWDWQDRDSELDVPAFDDGTSTNQWLFGCDVLWEC
jgi:hypothetical protein